MHFLGLDGPELRPGCEPRCFLADTPRANAIVLIHGLTDSTYYMVEIGKFFFSQMNFDVYIPLLSGHGLKIPTGMREITLTKWISEVDYAIQQALLRNPEVVLSIGGLSTGAALSVNRAILTRYIEGCVYLFSGAIHLTKNEGKLPVWVKESLLRFYPLILAIEYSLRKKKFIGENPYRYARMDYFGARLLAQLIKNNSRRLKRTRIKQPVFSVHSEEDGTADFNAIAKFTEDCQKGTFFPIQSEYHLPHASSVLRDPVLSSHGEILEPKNPIFGEMMIAIEEFTTRELKGVYRS